jgi:hypothetical protein
MELVDPLQNAKLRLCSIEKECSIRVTTSASTLIGWTAWLEGRIDTSMVQEGNLIPDCDQVTLWLLLLPDEVRSSSE